MIYSTRGAELATRKEEGATWVPPRTVSERMEPEFSNAQSAFTARRIRSATKLPRFDSRRRTTVPRPSNGTVVG